MCDVDPGGADGDAGWQRHVVALALPYDGDILAAELEERLDQSECEVSASAVLAC